MKSVFSRLIQQSSLYAVGNIALKVGGLILLPFYYQNLSGEAVGQWVLLDISAKVLMQLGGLGLAAGLLKYATEKRTDTTQEALPMTALLGALLSGSVLGLLLWFGAGEFASWSFAGTPDAAHWIQWLGVYVGCKIVSAIPMMQLRIDERPAVYVSLVILELIALIGGVYYALVIQGWGVLGVMMAYAGSAGVGLVILLFLFVIRQPWKIRWRWVKPLVYFGAPLVASGLAGHFLNMGDRYLIEWFMDTAEVGIYDLAGRMGSVLNLFFVHSFQLAFGVIGLKVMADLGQRIAVYRRTFRHYVIWAGWAVLGLTLLAFDVIILIAEESTFWQADALVLPIAMGFFAYGLYYIAINPVYASGRSDLVGLGVIGGAVLNVVLNMLLLPMLGMMGAALATLMAYFALAVYSFFWARRYLHVDYAWGTLAIVLCLVIGLYALGQPMLGWSAEMRLLGRLLLIGGYPLMILGLRLYTAEEIQRGWQLVRAYLKRPTEPS